MTILVRSGLAGGRVALWERHPDHPDGEVFVAGDVAVEAAETPAVLSRLESGRLARVEAEAEIAEPEEDQLAASADNLTRIDGIGPATAEKLAAAGVVDLTDLVAADAETLAAEIGGASAEQVAGWQEAALRAAGAESADADSA